MDLLVLSNTADGGVNGVTTLENSLVVSYAVKHTLNHMNEQLILLLGVY